jgi:hypothetical protein
MASVSQFAQHLLKLDPQRSVPRLTLYNYVKHVLDPSAVFSADTIRGFYGRVLQFESWQTDAKSLSDNVRTDVAGFLKTLVQVDAPESWLHMRHADALQVVPIRQFHDLEELMREEHQARLKSGAQLKAIRINDREGLCLLLDNEGTLEALVYPQLAVVWGARLRLLEPMTRLIYGSDMDLAANVRQVLDGSLMTTHCFQITSEGVQGLITRGHTFQKFETYIRAKLPETGDLFASLKKVERHFINPQTDPYYQELVSRLERGHRLLNHPTPQNLSEAERALNRGRHLLRTAFPNDRLLSLLVTHLEYGIQQHQSPAAQAQDTATSPSRVPSPSPRS